jgi:hypothetical protein
MGAPFREKSDEKAGKTFDKRLKRGRMQSTLENKKTTEENDLTANY